MRTASRRGATWPQPLQPLRLLAVAAVLALSAAASFAAVPAFALGIKRLVTQLSPVCGGNANADQPCLVDGGSDPSALGEDWSLLGTPTAIEIVRSAAAAAALSGASANAYPSPVEPELPYVVLGSGASPGRDAAFGLLPPSSSGDDDADEEESDLLLLNRRRCRQGGSSLPAVGTVPRLTGVIDGGRVGAHAREFLEIFGVWTLVGENCSGLTAAERPAASIFVSSTGPTAPLTAALADAPPPVPGDWETYKFLFMAAPPGGVQNISWIRTRAPAVPGCAVAVAGQYVREQSESSAFRIDGCEDQASQTDCSVSLGGTFGDPLAGDWTTAPGDRYIAGPTSYIELIGCPTYGGQSFTLSMTHSAARNQMRQSGETLGSGATVTHTYWVINYTCPSNPAHDAGQFPSPTVTIGEDSREDACQVPEATAVGVYSNGAFGVQVTFTDDGETDDPQCVPAPSESPDAFPLAAVIGGVAGALVVAGCIAFVVVRRRGGGSGGGSHGAGVVAAEDIGMRPTGETGEARPATLAPVDDSDGPNGYGISADAQLPSNQQQPHLSSREEYGDVTVDLSGGQSAGSGGEYGPMGVSGNSSADSGYGPIAVPSTSATATPDPNAGLDEYSSMPTSLNGDSPVAGGALEYGSMPASGHDSPA